VPAGTRINRALWTFRAIIALVALVLLAMILHPEAFRAQEPSAPQLATARGHTAQGVAMTMRFDRPGHPIAFSTRLRARCTNPSRAGSRDWSWGGWPADGWLRMAATFFYPVGTTTCDSGRVPFAVGATSARPS